MRKEVVFAIIAGLFIGLVGAYAVYRANRAFDVPKVSLSNQGGQSVSSSEYAPDNLTILEPIEEDLLTEDSVNVVGLARANSIVIVSSEDTDHTTRPDDNGNFEVKVNLKPGLNTIVIASFDESGSKDQTELDIVYSSQFDTTPSDPKVIVGSIIDITDNTIQISSKSDKIDLVSVDQENTSFEKDEEEISYADIAIGDYIIAMGTRDSKGVLVASRILVTTIPQDLDRKIFYGSVIDPGRRFINIENTDGERVSINTSAKLVIYNGKDEMIEMVDILQGAVIAVSGVMDEGELYARIIQVISSPINTPEKE